MATRVPLTARESERWRVRKRAAPGLALEVAAQNPRYPGTRHGSKQKGCSTGCLPGCFFPPSAELSSLSLSFSPPLPSRVRTRVA